MMFFAGSDFLHLLVPFIFVFAVTFGLLSSIPRAFPKNANVLIALVFGAVTTIYEPTANLIFNFLPYAVVILIALFFFVFVKKIFGGDDSQAGQKNKDVGTTLAILGISLLALGAVWNQLTGIMGVDISFSNNMLWIMGFFFIILILYAGTRGKD
jgi:hypothetical protein